MKVYFVYLMFNTLLLINKDNNGTTLNNKSHVKKIFLGQYFF
jgi:hypothetical protein